MARILLDMSKTCVTATVIAVALAFATGGVWRELFVRTSQSLFIATVVTFLGACLVTIINILRKED